MREIKINDIVQITDSAHHWYPALLIVDKIKPEDGITRAYLYLVNNSPDEQNDPAYIFIGTEQVEKVGQALIVCNRAGIDSV